MKYLQAELPSTSLEWRRLTSLLYGLLFIFQMGLLNSKIMPFFPVEASQNKNCTATQIGLTLGVYDAATMTIRILVAHKIGTNLYKPLFIASFALHATCSILFGLMAFVQHSFLFFLGCFILRALLGAANALGWIALIALAMNWYPDQKTFVFSSVEASVYLG